jgi:flagellar hook-associated protein 1 FlgK
MSISGAMNAALSGLNAAARGAEVVSTNIANAQTPGFGRRELVTTVRALGATSQGVQVAGILRHSDPVAVGDRRLAEAGSGGRDVTTAFLKRIETVIGTQDSETSLNKRIDALDRALIEATARPDSESRLASVAQAARNVTNHLATASTEVQSQRAIADDRIEDDVKMLNTSLQKVVELNAQILANNSSGRDATGLMDQRQKVIDHITQILPIRDVARDGGKVALFTTGGAMLVDGSASTFGFVPVGVITPDMTLQSGALSGLTLNGQSIPTSAEAGLISGGTMAAHFTLRDVFAPDMQNKLDAVARDLIERFADPALDPSRAAGDAGLFTDAGGVFDPANENGLAQRLRLNALADPQQGGQLWRLRAGLGATGPGDPGDSTLLQNWQSALIAQRNPVSGGFTTGTRSFGTLAADMVSGVATARLTAESESSFASARLDTLRGTELANGVDTDQEMQNLLLIEQAFAANAKVISAADDMIKTLMGF